MILSIIIPVYNRFNYLEKCLGSMTNQVFNGIEIIVIDDFSTDESLRIIQDFQLKDNRIKLLKNSKNIGIGATRNRGILEAKGKFIWFVDSDDWVDEDSFAVLLNTLSKKNDCSLILFGHTRHYSDREGNKLRQKLIPTYDDKDDLVGSFIQLKKGLLSYVWIYLYPKNLLLKNNIVFQEDIYYEDILFVAKSIYYSDKLQVIRKSLYNYNCGNHESVTRTISKKNIFDILFVYDSLYSFLEVKGLIKQYNDEFFIRFLLFGLTFCLYNYEKLPEKEQNSRKLKKELRYYFNPNYFDEVDLNFVSDFIDSIDENDIFIKNDYRSKLQYLIKSKHKWNLEGLTSSR